jgi:uncharacterized protein (TIGR03067 family)
MLLSALIAFLSEVPMRYSLPMALFVGVTLVALSAAAQDEKSNADKKAIQGTWTGKKGDNEVRLTFAAEKLTIEIGAKKIQATFALDSSKTPKHIDVTVVEVSEDDAKKYEGKTSKGIFELDGDRLKWLAATPGGDDRPEALPQEGENPKGLYLSLEREKK